MSRVDVKKRNKGIIPQTRLMCQLRVKTTDEWIDAPFLSPVEFSETIVPSMQTAQLKYSYGSIARAYRREYSLEFPTDARDIQVRIQQIGARKYDKRITDFAGVVKVDRHMIGGGQTNNDDELINSYGDQSMKAYGPEFFLDRAQIIQSHWLQGETAVFLGIAPTFNRRGSGGIVVGNRSELVFNQKAHLLVENAEKWSAYDILKYLLEWTNIDGGLTYELTGQIEPLQRFYPVLETAGKTIWNVITELTNKNRGIAASIVWDGESDVVKIEFMSNTDVALEGEEFGIPANPNIVDLNLSKDRRIQNVEMGEDTLPQVDVLIVRGGMFSTTFTISPLDGAIVGGWSTEQETASKRARRRPSSW